jgi:hypothetical protein
VTKIKIKKIPRKIASHSVTAVLTIGVIAAFGLLSASGMLLITPSLFFVISAFLFGGLAEGEVFNQEITEGLRDLFLFGKRGYRELINNGLKCYLKNHPANSGFLAEYQLYQDFLYRMRGKKISDEQKKEKRTAKKRIKHMQIYFARYVYSQKKLAGPYEQDEELNAAITELRQQMPSYKARMTFFRIALPFSLLCGAGFGFATASALPAALAAIGLSLSFMVWPLAAVAAIGYTFLILHTAKEILFSDSFRKWKEMVKKWFVPGSEGVTAKFVLKAAALGLVTAGTVALCIMGTLATAGTWWIAVKHGAKLIPFLKAGANIIRSILTPAAAAGNFIFSIFNSFESIRVVSKMIQTAKPGAAIKQKWQLLRQEENWLQILNPFRLISKTIQYSADVIVFVGHVLASGTARDRFMNVPEHVLAVTTAGSEFTQDFTFFFEGGKKTMVQKLVMLALSPLLVLSAGWQSLVSQGNSDDKKISFKDALRQAFSIREKPEYSGEKLPPLSHEFRQAEILHYFKKQEKRLGATLIKHEIAENKQNVLSDLKKRLLIHEKSSVELSSEERNILHDQRFFGRRLSSSEKFADRMINQFSEKSADYSL